MTKKKTTKEFIKEAQKIHGDLYDYSKVIYINNKTKVIIICQKHGDFPQTPDNHLHGHKCQKCTIGKLINSRRRTLENFIKAAQKIHGDIYDYSKVIYKNNATNIIIICTKHGDFPQTPSNHLKGEGCRSCGIDRMKFIRRKSLENFIKDCQKIHGSKYDYSKVDYINCHTQVIIICKKHGDFDQLPSNHLKGEGCNVCSNNQLKTLEQFIIDANNKHNFKYDYSKVEYKNSKIKVIIICKIHGDFDQLPQAHLQGQGCPICSNNQRKTLEKFISEANEIHNFKYDYSKVKYENSKTNVIIICKIHGDFQQLPLHHLRGSCCPICAINNYSKLCIKWLKLIENYYFNVNIQHAENGGEKLLRINGRRYKLDGYYEDKYREKYVVFEFNGCFWHGCEKCYCKTDINNVNHKLMQELYDKTKEKEENIINHNFQLITIWECEFDELLKNEEKLDEYLESLRPYFATKVIYYDLNGDIVNFSNE